MAEASNNGKGRKLKAEVSNEEAPDKKFSRGTGEDREDPEMEKEDEENEGDQDVKTMMRSMMSMMKGMQADMKEVKTEMQDVKGAAKEAKVTADAALTATGLMQSGMKNLRDDLPQIVQKIIHEQGLGQEVRVDKGSGKGGGKDDTKQEGRARTIIFSNFPEESQADDIIHKITEYVASVKDDIDEVYTYAKTGTRGAARFTTGDAMWRYMTKNKGNHKYEHEGRRIYAKAAGGAVTEEEERREKAVRKVVRALIEREGGNGDVVKQRIDAKYHWGTVWWKKPEGKWEKVAQWNKEDSKMTMMGTAASLQEVVAALLQ